MMLGSFDVTINQVFPALTGVDIGISVTPILDMYSGLPGGLMSLVSAVYEVFHFALW